GIHGKFVGQNVKHFTVFWKRDVARGIDGAADIFTLDVAGTSAQGDAASAIQPAHMTASDTDQSGLHRNAGNAFRFFHRAANGADRRVEINDGAFSQAFRFSRAASEEFHLLLGKLRDKNTGFSATDVQTDKIFILFRQSPPPPQTYLLFFSTVTCSPQ